MRIWAGVLVLLATLAPAAVAGEGKAALIELDGAIGPASSGYFDKAQRHAIDAGASVIVLRIDTPGGLDGAMRDIIKGILNSPVPVLGFVAPGGARAASAGTYILYACHVAAMAPATNLGAATPVPVGGSAPWPGPAKPVDDAKDKKDKDKKAEDAPAVPEAGDAMSHKVVNDAVAYLRSLAEKRGRNADWAEKAVREGASLSAERALDAKVVDFIAGDVDELLRKADGRKVTTSAGEIALKTAGLAVDRIEPDWRMHFLAIITNPTVAYILLLIGIYGLLLEGYHPGAVLPGVVGGISLLLALFAFQVLPVNYAGLALILLGVVLMIAEMYTPGFGALGVGGVAAFVFGSILLMDIDVPGYEINRGVVFGMAASAAVVLGTTLFLVLRARRARVVTGSAAMLGQVVDTLEFHDGQGWAMLGGERWRVRSVQPLATGQRARVVRMDGLVLEVEAMEERK